MPDLRTIYTIGHSTRSIEELAELLKENGVELLVDVRTIPMSRTNPQFNKETVPESLGAFGIAYRHLPTLGGLRGKRKDLSKSENSAWENSSFRNYADYAETEAFRNGLQELIELASARVTAYMCSEAVWWRCHRRIITDYMLAKGWHVRHIMAPGKTDEASMNKIAKPMADGRILYPADQQELGL